MWNPEIHFDDHQFYRRRGRVVEAHVTADGFATTGISFQDFGGMHVTDRGRKKRERRLPTPDWANTDETLRKRVLDCLERRLYLRGGEDLTDFERLDRIETASKAGIPALKAELANQVKRYSEDQKTGLPEYLASLAVEIQNRDSEIVLRQRGLASLMIAAVYKYYRLGWNSTQIANDLGIKPPMVRIWMWRVNGKSGSKRNQQRIAKHPWPAERIAIIKRLRAQGLAWHECAKRLSVSDGSLMRHVRLAGLLDGKCIDLVHLVCLRREGVSSADIARKFGYTVGSIRRHLRTGAKRFISASTRPQ